MDTLETLLAPFGILLAAELVGLVVRAVMHVVGKLLGVR